MESAKTMFSNLTRKKTISAEHLYDEHKQKWKIAYSKDMCVTSNKAPWSSTHKLSVNVWIWENESL